MRTLADIAAALVATLTAEERDLLRTHSVDLAERLVRGLDAAPHSAWPPTERRNAHPVTALAAITCPKCGGRRWTHVQHEAQTREGKVYRNDEDGSIALFMDDGTMQGYDAEIDYLYCGAPVGEPYNAYGHRRDCGHRIPMPKGVEYDWGVCHDRPVKGWTEVE